MQISRLFDVFSRRPSSAKKKRHDIPEKARKRVLIWWMKCVIAPSPYMAADMVEAFWAEIHGQLQVRLATLKLSDKSFRSKSDDMMAYLTACPGEEFLDVLEDMFQTQYVLQSGGSINVNKVVSELNDLLRIDDLPYYLTNLVMEIKETEKNGRQFTSSRILAYPKVMMRESEVLHENAMVPALTLLQNPIFANADTEFLAALEDYRKGDFSDCLVKCGSSFESFMKVLCDKKGWRHKNTDAASALIKTIIGNTTLEPYFEQLLIIVATLRNKLSSAHGAGTSKKTVSQHLAQYAINVTASCMVLLASEADL